MKILQVLSSINPNCGGVAESVKQISLALNKISNQVEILSLDNPSSQFLYDYPLPVTALQPSRGTYSYNPNLVPWLKKNAGQFDAVIVNGIWQYHSFAVRNALRGTKIPYFVFPHGMLDPWFKSAYPVKHLKKWMYWPWAEYRVLRDAKAVLFTCEEERLLARKSFWLYKLKEVVTTFGTASPNTEQPLSENAFLEKYPHLRGKRLMFFLGRIHEKKGCDLLIKAFRQICHLDEKLHLVIAGPDNMDRSTELKRLAEHLGVNDRIEWTGMLHDEIKWGAFYAAEAFCLPSHQENFGIVVAEALACGKPVLISNKVNIWREILMDECGFVDEDTIEGTARNLQRWINLDSDNRTRMGAQASLCFARRFHINHAAKQLAEILGRG